MSETVKKAPIFVASADAQILHSRLKDSKPGDVITYEELTKAIRRDVTAEARGVLRTARSIARRENKIVFGCIVTVGLKHLEDRDTVRSVADDRKRIGNASRRSRKKLETVDFAALDKGDRERYAAEGAIGIAIEELAKPSTAKRIASRVAPDQRLVPLVEVMMQTIRPEIKD